MPTTAVTWNPWCGEVVVSARLTEKSYGTLRSVLKLRKLKAISLTGSSNSSNNKPQTNSKGTFLPCIMMTDTSSPQATAYLRCLFDSVFVLIEVTWLLSPEVEFIGTVEAYGSTWHTKLLIFRSKRLKKGSRYSKFVAGKIGFTPCPHHETRREKIAGLVLSRSTSFKGESLLLSLPHIFLRPFHIFYLLEGARNTIPNHLVFHRWQRGEIKGCTSSSAMHFSDIYSILCDSIQ